jgi:hypothetical protein
MPESEKPHGADKVTIYWPDSAENQEKARQNKAIFIFF